MRGATRARRLVVRSARAAARWTGGRWSVPGLLSVVLTVGESPEHLEESLAAALGQAHGRLEVLVAGVGEASVLPRRPADDRVRVLGRYADLAEARAAGLAAAAGLFVTFLDADHLPTGHGYAAAVGSLHATGSGAALLASRVHRRGRTFDPDDWVRLVHSQPAPGVTARDRPVLLADTDAAAAVFRAATVRAVAAGPGILGEDITLLAAVLGDQPVDVLGTVGVLLRALQDRTGPAHLPLDLAGIRRVAAAGRRAHALLPADVAPWHTGYLLGRLLPPYLDLLWHETDVREALPEILAELVPLAGAAAADAVPAQQKALHHLLATDPQGARVFLGAVRPSPRRHPTSPEQGRVLLDLAEWADLPGPARALAGVETQVRAEVTSLETTEHHGEVRGWAYLDALDPAGPPTTDLRWVREDGAVVALATETVADPAADRLSDLAYADVTPTGFRARFALADLAHGPWALEAHVGERGLAGTGRAVIRPWTMAGLAPRRDGAGRALVIDHDDLQQLRLEVRDPVHTVTACAGGDGLELSVTGPDVTAVALRPLGGGALVPLPLRTSDGAAVASIDPAGLEERSPYEVEVTARAGVLRRGLVATSDADCAWPGRRGGLLVAAPARCGSVVGVWLAEEELVVELRLDAGVTGWRTALVQGVTETPGALRALGEDRFEARYSLTGPGGLPLAAGEHVLSLANDHRAGWFAARPAADALPREELQARMRLRVEAFAPDLPAVRLVVSAPLADDERGERHQRLLREAARVEVAERRSVFFRAMFGEHTTGNGLGVHEELRRRGSTLELLWAVADRSVPVPPGGVGVVEHSRAWHEAIARSRYHMVDVHQVEWFRRPEGQVLIETMHGYPYKLMGHPWWRAMGNSVQEIASLDRRTRDWSAFVSPATYATPLLREAFLDPAGANDVRVLETGYPRNDALLRPEAAVVRVRTRDLLGLTDEQVAVLYAPTFRDYLSAEDRTARAVTFFDVDEALAALPERYVVLRRGHAFNARVRDDRLRASARFRDVTDHPDVNDLILASDAGVLDYSSLRFDYVLSGNPMVFLVPDLEEYDRHRGGVIPYGPTAPGPWTTTTAETVSWLGDLDRLRDEYAAARAAFRADYVDLEDGHAAARLVDAVFAPEDR